MQTIALNDFDQLIGQNRFVKGNEISWFKSFNDTEHKIAAILAIDGHFQAVVYKLKQNNKYYVDNYRLFLTNEETLNFLEKELS